MDIIKLKYLSIAVLIAPSRRCQTFPYSHEVTVQWHFLLLFILCLDAKLPPEFFSDARQLFLFIGISAPGLWIYLDCRRQLKMKKCLKICSDVDALLFLNQRTDRFKMTRYRTVVKIELKFCTHVSMPRLSLLAQAAL